MKLKFKLLTVLIALSCLTVTAGNNEYNRRIHRSFSKNDVSSLNITNKYGEITINDLGGDSVTIDVTIVVENAYQGKAEYLLKQIEIGISKSGKTVIAKTNITEDFKTKQKFSINYNVNIPADRNLDISNKYGNLTINKLEANGKFNIAYGNITAQTMKVPSGASILLNLSYSKADFQTINNMNATIQYSKLFMGETDKLQLESKYSTISIDKINQLKAISKYDGFSIDKIESLEAESKYTHYNIDKLEKKFVLNSEYGNIDVDEIAEGFEAIDITSSYGGIKLGLDKRAYKLLADCSYCGVDYPKDQFSGNHEKDNQNLKIEGKVGSGTANVHITSKYGEVKLME